MIQASVQDRDEESPDMIDLRKSSDRFRTRLDWLESRHGFSFGHHHDPANLRHGPLRVVNEDWIAPRAGFPMHEHREMEILTYVLDGVLSHRDSKGNQAEVRPGRTQLMHAGTGIAHSEINQNADARVHLLQIWLEPDERGTRPGYEAFDFSLTHGEPVVLASPGASAGGLDLRQDATISALRLETGRTYEWSIDRDRLGWVQVAKGAGRVGSLPVEPGDALALSQTRELTIEASTDSELLLFDLPPESGL